MDLGVLRHLARLRRELDVGSPARFQEVNDGYLMPRISRLFHSPLYWCKRLTDTGPDIERLHRHMTNLVQAVAELAVEPTEEAAFCQWVEQKDIQPFLEASLHRDDFVLHANFCHVLIDVVAVPESLVSPPDSTDLLAWRFDATSSWGISDGEVYPSLDDAKSKALTQGTQLVFARSFEGRTRSKKYIEICQRLVHMFDLHFLVERNAYCRLDKHGDIEAVINIEEIPDTYLQIPGIIVTVSEVLHLDQLVVEGFEGKWLRRRAIGLGRKPESKFRSLKLIEECLIGLGFEEEHAVEITRPLHEVHALRSKLSAHASGESGQGTKQGILNEHGSYRKHFSALCKVCDDSIRTIAEAFGQEEPS